MKLPPIHPSVRFVRLAVLCDVSAKYGPIKIG